jgi:thiol-disulfide isomerase/thioredoxin
MRKQAENQVATAIFPKRPIFQRLVWLVVMSFLILACSLFDTSPLLNNAAPDFTLETLGGREVQLSQFKGKPVMINFWATWCGPCRAELPLIQDRFEKHYPNLVVLAVEDGSTPNEISEAAYAMG